MTAKEYLMQLQLLDTKIIHKKQELAQLRSVLLGRAVQYGPDRVQSSAGNAQEVIAVKCLDLEGRVRDMIEVYMNRMDKIIDEIHRLGDARYIRILHDHYVPDTLHRVKSLEQVAVEMNYSYQHVCRLHGEALQSFSRLNMRVNESKSVVR